MSPTTATSGAYGYHVIGASDLRDAVDLGPTTVPSISLACEDGRGRAPSPFVGVTAAVIDFVDDEWAVLDRSSRTATLFTRSRVEDGRLTHPVLTAVAIVFAWWDGRIALHGGAVLTAEGAWGILGAREAGKSTLLAALAAAGHGIVADDLLVLESGRVHSGPRCIDLRPGADDALGLSMRTRPVRGGDRLRVEQPAVAASALFLGWVSLVWGERVSTRRLGPQERMQQLTAQACTPPAVPGDLVDLMALPAYELSRPRTWTSTQSAVEALLDLTTASL